jgi:hypothetical protein
MLKIRKLWLLAALALAAPMLTAECLGMNVPLKAFAFESVTVSTSAVGLTSATYKPSGQVAASIALVQVEAQPLRWSVASTPTAAIGHAAVDTNAIKLCGLADITAFLAIRSGGTDSVLRVTYFRPR